MFQAPPRRDNVSPFLQPRRVLNKPRIPRPELQHWNPPPAAFGGHPRQRRTRPRRGFCSSVALLSAVPAGLMAGGIRGFPEVVGYLLSSVRDLAPLRLREPRVETRGCFLSSLSGLNLYAALIPFSFLPNETQSGRAADLRANLPATHIRHLRCRSENGDDVGKTGCVPGVETATSRGARPPRPPRPLCPQEDKNAGETPAPQEKRVPARRPAPSCRACQSRPKNLPRRAFSVAVGLCFFGKSPIRVEKGQESCESRSRLPWWRC